MSNTHWSQTAHDVRVFGVNAVVCIPLLCWIIRPMVMSLLVVFFIVTAFYIIVENVLKLKARYVPCAVRYRIMGTVRSPINRNIDL